MGHNKTGVVVLFLLAGFFIIAMAMVFNTSARRSAAMQKQDEIDKKISELSSRDLTVYWIGDVPKEFEKLKPKMQIVKPAEINKDNMPIQSSTFHITIKDGQGNEQNIVPRDYSDYMIIVITTGDGFSDEGKDVLRNCIAENGVPVIAVGDKACNMLGGILVHGAGYSPDHSVFYKLKEGYDEPFLDPKAVAAGGADFADELCGKLCAYLNNEVSRRYVEASSRVSAAFSSVDEQATATTSEGETEETTEGSESETESTENSTSETNRNMLVRP